MEKFIVSDDFNRPGGEAEIIVWEKVKESFKGRNVIAYSKYPLFARVGEQRREPDILMLDQNEGLIIIQVKEFKVDEINNIKADKWFLNNQVQSIVSPIQQAEDYFYAMVSRFQAERQLRDKIKSRAVVALPYITSQEWCDHFGEESRKNIIFMDDLKPNKLLERVLAVEAKGNGNNLNDDEYNIALSVLGYERKYVKECI